LGFVQRGIARVLLTIVSLPANFLDQALRKVAREAASIAVRAFQLAGEASPPRRTLFSDAALIG